MANFLKLNPTTGLPTGTAMALTDLPSIANNTVLGNISGSSATPTALTGANVNTFLPVFTSSLNGLAPASGGGTTNFLRADGTWAAAGGGSGTVTSVGMTVPAFLSVTPSTITTSGTFAVTLSGSALPAVDGGTGLTSYTTGDTLYASATNTLSRLPIGTQGQVLTVAATGLPAWQTNPITTFQPVVAMYGVSTAASTTANTPYNFDTKIVDTNNAVTVGVGSWKFTAPVAGFYIVSSLLSNGGSADNRIFKNGTAQWYVQDTPNIDLYSGASGIQLNAGDYISICPNVTTTTNGATAPAFTDYITITQVSGGSATGAIAALYTGNYTMTGSPSVVVMPTIQFDTNSAYSTSTGLFTAPVSGTYSVSAELNTSAYNSIFTIYVNGVAKNYIGQSNPSGNGLGTGTGIVKVNAGDTIGLGGVSGSAGGTTQSLSFNLISGGAGIISSSNVQGTVSGGNATAGYLGEFISSNPGSPVTPASSTSFANVASISLTAGDWDVYGTVNLSTSATTATNLQIGVSTSSAAQDSTNNGGISSTSSVIGSGSLYLATAPRRINITSTTTVYLVAALTYSVAGTDSYTTSSQIEARRVR